MTISHRYSDDPFHMPDDMQQIPILMAKRLTMDRLSDRFKAIRLQRNLPQSTAISDPLLYR